MRGIQQDYVIRQGATFELLMVLYDVLPQVGEGGVLLSPGTPSDLTGITFRSAFRAGDVDGQVQASLPAGAWTTELRAWGVYGLLPTVVGTLSATLTAALTALTGVYDVEAVQGDIVRELQWGSYTLAREATR